MPKALLLQCSPHAKGSSDALCEYFAHGIRRAGLKAELLAIRNCQILPCTGCNACALSPHRCILEKKDEAEAVFAKIADADLLLVAAPIYFYALPAGFKALIDRAQRFWALQSNTSKEKSGPMPRPALALLVAGRKEGARLFAGTLSTLRYFFQAIGFTLCSDRCLRGVECRDDLVMRETELRDLEAWGLAWGERLLTGK